MTGKQRTPPEGMRSPVETTPEVQHRAARVVAAHTDPDDARALLDVLGLPTGQRGEEGT